RAGDGPPPAFGTLLRYAAIGQTPRHDALPLRRGRVHAAAACPACRGRYLQVRRPRWKPALHQCRAGERLEEDFLRRGRNAWTERDRNQVRAKPRELSQGRRRHSEGPRRVAPQGADRGADHRGAAARRGADRLRQRIGAANTGGTQPAAEIRRAARQAAAGGLAAREEHRSAEEGTCRDALDNRAEATGAELARWLD